MVPGRFKHLRFFSKTNRAVFLLAVLIVLLLGCSGGSDGSGSPDPTTVGSDGSSEQPRALPFFLHDFDTFVTGYLGVSGGGLGGLSLAPGAFLKGHIKISSPGHAAIGFTPPVEVYDRPWGLGSATFNPLDDLEVNFHYTADKCYYPEEESETWKYSQSSVFTYTNNGETQTKTVQF